MPAQVPQATFLPLPPELDVAKLIDATPNFEEVQRIPNEQIEAQGFEAFERLVLLHVVLQGKPLVIEGYQKHLPPRLFSSAWLRQNVGRKCEFALWRVC